MSRLTYAECARCKATRPIFASVDTDDGVHVASYQCCKRCSLRVWEIVEMLERLAARGVTEAAGYLERRELPDAATLKRMKWTTP